MKVDIHQAKSQLALLAELVEKGETVIITRAGKPCVDLVPHYPVLEPREPGRLKGRIAMGSDFDPTPVAIFQDFEPS